MHSERSRIAATQPECEQPPAGEDKYAEECRQEGGKKERHHRVGDGVRVRLQARIHARAEEDRCAGRGILSVPPYPEGDSATQAGKTSHYRRDDHDDEPHPRELLAEGQVGRMPIIKARCQEECGAAERRKEDLAECDQSFA